MKRNPRRLSERLQDILEAIDNVRSDIVGMDREAFLEDGKTQRAVIESIIVIGEAANRVTALAPAIKDDQPALWQHLRDAYDMRIILTHEYFRVDASIVWTTVHASLEELEAAVSEFLKDSGTDSGT